MSSLAHMLLALVVIVAVARALGAAFAWLRQPAVVGEIVAGIFLGPSLLGRVAPSVANFVLPAEVAPLLGMVAQIGVVLFMFLVGLELDTGMLAKRTRASLAVSQASIVVPFVFGGLLAFYLYPRVGSSHVPFWTFALFIAVSMSVTAFPVLARILTDRKIQKTRLGVIALACAAFGDVTAWCLLAVVVSIARTHASHAIWTVGLVIAFVLVMFLVVRPLVVRFSNEKREFSQRTLAIALVGLLASALATEAIGVHALFGAFVFGAILPHDGSLAREMSARLTDVVVVLLLPAFFAFTGLRTSLGLAFGAEQWVPCLAIIGVAVLGKFGGTFVAARATGLPWDEAASLGVLMNTRGLMELIVLNVGLDLGVISPALFAMLVLMALVTTFATTPLLSLIALRATAAERASRRLRSE